MILAKVLYKPESIIPIYREMKGLLITTILSISFFASISWCASVSPFSTTEQKGKVFSLVDNDYEDTRIDYNGDKIIDFWRVKKGNLLIEVYYEGNQTLYHLRRFSGSSVNEKILLSEKDKLIILKSGSRKQHILTFTTQGPLCIGDQASEWEKIKTNISEISRPLVISSTEAFVGEQCFEAVEPDTYSALTSSARDIFSLPGKTSNSALDCLEGNGTRELFIKKFGEKDGLLNYEKAVIGFKNSIIKFSNMKTGDEPILTCKMSMSEKIDAPMKVTESGTKIQFQFGKKVDVSKIKEQLFHESIHISSVSDEELSQAITNLCVNQKVTKIEKLKIGGRSSSFSSALTTLDIKQGELEAAQKGSQEIPKSIAEAPKQPTKDQSPQDMNRIAEAGGKQLVASESHAQTGGVVRMAEVVLGPAPAVAAEPTALATAASRATLSPSAFESSETSTATNRTPSTYSESPVSVAQTTSADSSSTSRQERTSSREPASEYQLDMRTVSGKAPKVYIPTANSQNGKGANGEYIKEEVDLTRTTPTGISPGGGSRQPAAANTNAGIKQAHNTEPGTSDVGNSGGSGSGFTSSGAASANLESTSSGGTRSQQRRSSSSSSGSNGGTYTPGRDEVVSFISGGSYRQARSKLNDQNFVQTLKDNNITIYDLSGNSYGANRGEVIFVDQGDRFVRQK